MPNVLRLTHAESGGQETPLPCSAVLSRSVARRAPLQARPSPQWQTRRDLCVRECEHSGASYAGTLLLRRGRRPPPREDALVIFQGRLNERLERQPPSLLLQAVGTSKRLAARESALSPSSAFGEGN